MDGTSKLKYCPCCMELGSMEGMENCPRCGRGLDGVENGKEELPIYSVIGGQYMAGKSMEAEGDSILYIGLDLAEKKRVWIREFFCRSLAYRNPGSPSIHTYAGQKEAYLKKYDACVREYQKAGNGKKTAFANGTAYQIECLSEEEILALCQPPDAAEGQGADSGRKEEKKALPEKREKKKAFASIASSKKMKVAAIAILAACLAVTLLQKHGPGKEAGNAGKEARSASASLQLKRSKSPDPSSSASADDGSASGEPGGTVPAKKPADSKAESKEEKAQKAKKSASSKEEKKSATPKTTKKPASSKAAREPVSSKNFKRPASTKKPARSDKKSAPARKSTKKDAPKAKKQKPKSVIDDSALDKKVYEID